MALFATRRYYTASGDWVTWNVNDEFGTPIAETGAAEDLRDWSPGADLVLPAFSESSVSGLLQYSFADRVGENYSGKLGRVIQAQSWELKIEAKATAAQPGDMDCTISIKDQTGATVVTIEESFNVSATSYTIYTATGSCAGWGNYSAKDFTLSVASATFEDIQVNSISFSIPVVGANYDDGSDARSGGVMWWL